MKKHYTFINTCTLYTIRNKNHILFNYKCHIFIVWESTFCNLLSKRKKIKSQ